MTNFRSEQWFGDAMEIIKQKFQLIPFKWYVCRYQRTHIVLFMASWKQPFWQNSHSRYSAQAETHKWNIKKSGKELYWWKKLKNICFHDFFLIWNLNFLWALMWFSNNKYNESYIVYKKKLQKKVLDLDKRGTLVPWVRVVGEFILTPSHHPPIRVFHSNLPTLSNLPTPTPLRYMPH